MVREAFSHYVKIKVEWFSILQHTSQSGITGFHVPDQLVEVVSRNNVRGVQDEHRFVVTLHDGLILKTKLERLRIIPRPPGVVTFSAHYIVFK